MKNLNFYILNESIIASNTTGENFFFFSGSVEAAQVAQESAED